VGRWRRVVDGDGGAAVGGGRGLRLGPERASGLQRLILQRLIGANRSSDPEDQSKPTPNTHEFALVVVNDAVGAPLPPLPPPSAPIPEALVKAMTANSTLAA
jgi:hypothetical protein